MLGSDGTNYQFLLKGHEDLRQDERVMQLFGLINVCLDNDRATGSKGLGIVRYSVMPLSNNSGVIGWVENCDTLNQLVKQYRESKDMRLGIEVKLLQTKSLNHDKLPLLNKVEIFKQVFEETTGALMGAFSCVYVGSCRPYQCIPFTYFVSSKDLTCLSNLLILRCSLSSFFIKCHSVAHTTAPCST